MLPTLTTRRTATTALVGAAALTAAYLVVRRARLRTSCAKTESTGTSSTANSSTAVKSVDEWWRLSAVEVVAALRAGRVTPEQLIDSAVARIQDTEAINAVVTLCEGRARRKAAEYQAAGGAPGPLFGLPVLVKECQPVEGCRNTSGSRLYTDRVAGSSHVIVTDLEAAGAIVLGITNMPEFAAGSHTFNEVFGVTRNPHNLTRSAGGSSGGSAAALAVGGAWLATGTDLGGSLRNPAAFSGVGGLRTSPGRCSTPATGPGEWRGRWGLGLHSVQGPMARSVGDLALLLDALAPESGPNPATNWLPDAVAPLPPPPAGGYLAHVHAALAVTSGSDASNCPPAESTTTSTIPPAPELPVSIAWSVNLGGLLKGQGVHPEISDAVKRAAHLLATACGATTVQQAAPPGLDGAHAIFKPLRFSRNLDMVAGGPGPKAEAWLATHGKLMKPELHWEFQEGLASGWQGRVAAAEHARQELEANVVRFLSAFDLLVCPVTLMPPFDHRIRYPAISVPPPGRNVPRVRHEDYIEWMLPCTVISLSGCPALSLPVGFTSGEPRLPLAVQLVARPGGEASLLAAAACLERELKTDTRPIAPVAPTSGAGSERAGLAASMEWIGPRTEAEAAKHLRAPITRGAQPAQPS